MSGDEKKGRSEAPKRPPSETPTSVNNTFRESVRAERPVKVAKPVQNTAEDAKKPPKDR